jgi:hypothetical protein
LTVRPWISVEASDDSRSEDWGDSRLRLQTHAVVAHSRAALRGDPAGCDDASGGDDVVAVVVARGGRASVALAPTESGPAVQRALLEVQAGGEANLAAALKLAAVRALAAGFFFSFTLRCARATSPACALASLQMVGSRFASTRIVAFLAGPLPALAHDDAESLRRRLAASRVSHLTLAALASHKEAGAAACASLDALHAPSSSDAGEGSSCCAVAVAFLEAAAAPSAAAEGGEAWQAVEALVELMGDGPVCPPRILESSSADEASSSAAAAAAAARAAAPRARATCRGGSLDRYHHLSSTGMLHRGLPNYCTLQQRMQAAAAQGAAAPQGGATASAGECCLQVQSIPRFRTLLKVPADALPPPRPPPPPPQQAALDAVPPPAPPPPAPPPSWQRGVLRVLQDLHASECLLLTWHPDTEAPGAAAAAAAAAALALARARAEAAALRSPAPPAGEPLDIFSAARRGGAGVAQFEAGRRAGAAAAAAALVACAQASAVAAAGGVPLMYRGVEHWQACGAHPPLAFSAPLLGPAALEAGADAGAGAAGEGVGVRLGAASPGGRMPRFRMRRAWDLASSVPPAFLAAAAGPVADRPVQAAVAPAAPPPRSWPRAAAAAAGPAAAQLGLCAAWFAGAAAFPGALLGCIAAAAAWRAVERCAGLPDSPPLLPPAMRRRPPSPHPLLACLARLQAAPPAVDFAGFRRALANGEISVAPTTIGLLPREVVTRLAAAHAAAEALHQPLPLPRPRQERALPGAAAAGAAASGEASPRRPRPAQEGPEVAVAPGGAPPPPPGGAS